MLLEDILVDAVHHLEVDGVALLRTFLRRQGTQIFCQKWGNGIGIAVAHDEEFEVVAISETFLINLDDAVVVDAVEVFGLGAEGTPMVVVYDLGNGVLQSGCRLKLSVLHGSLAALDVGVVSLKVLTWSREMEVSELQHSLEVLLHTSTRDTFTVCTHISVGRSLLASHLLVEFCGAEIAPATNAHPIDIVGLVVFIFAIQRSSTPTVSAHADLVG